MRKIDYQYFMEIRASLDDPTPTATSPLHHTVSAVIVNPDSEQCGEDTCRHCHPPHCTTHYAFVDDLISMS